jgi:hypothetical protein
VQTSLRRVRSTIGASLAAKARMSYLAHCLLAAQLTSVTFFRRNSTRVTLVARH